MTSGGNRKRVFLAHWKDIEAEERSARLQAAGFDVTYGVDGPQATRGIRAQAPDAVVIDLGRLPSHGRELATWIRTTKATRHLPIVFVDGDPAKVARVADTFPDCEFTAWRGIGSAVKRAIAHPPTDVTPMQGPDYSRTPLPKKLGVKAGVTLALLGAPARFDATLGPLPDGVRVRKRAQGRCDVIVLFAKSRADLTRRFGPARSALADGGGLWIAWPKKTSGVKTDIDQRFVMDHVLESDLVDNKVCAIDSTWSGLRFQRRRKGR